MWVPKHVFEGGVGLLSRPTCNDWYQGLVRHDLQSTYQLHTCETVTCPMTAWWVERRLHESTRPGRMIESIQDPKFGTFWRLGKSQGRFSLRDRSPILVPGWSTQWTRPRMVKQSICRFSNPEAPIPYQSIHRAASLHNKCTDNTFGFVISVNAWWMHHMNMKGRCKC